MDQTHDILHYGRHPLDAIFAPKSVAVVGATEKAGSVGRTLLWNLISSPFGGTVFPVNSTRSSVLGIKAYPSIAAAPGKVDLAVIATPAPTVPGIVDECVAAGVQGAIIISAGFKERGEEGAALERQILEKAQRGKLRVVGPNCLGVMSPFSGLNATFASAIARRGNVGFISQSGALCTAVLDWSLRELVGFSAFVSIGSMVDVGWGDLINYLGNDPHTEGILIYMESIGDARAFLSAGREVALNKPIIVLKAGRTAAAAKAAASHTGSLAGSDEVLDAAFRRSGVLRVDRIADLFYMAEVLAKQPRPGGPRLTVITNAGGPGVLATDHVMTVGGQMAQLSSQTMETLSSFLPAHWSHNNPVDILGDAGPDRYAKALDVLTKDPGTDGILVILTPQAMTDPTQTAEQLKPYARVEGKPILASWMGGAEVQAGRNILNLANIPSFEYPDTAARAFSYMWQYSYNLRGLYETPHIPPADSDQGSRGRSIAQEIVTAARTAGRTILTEFESKRLLAVYDIPTVETQVAASVAEAQKIAQGIGYPVVLKLHSETITHKTDVGGVRLNLADADAVAHAYQEIESSVCTRAHRKDFQGVSVQPFVRLEGYEIIIGSSIDPQFGPVLLFGTGGQMVEVYKDRILGLPPLNTTLARRMMEQTRIFEALKGIRGRKPVDLNLLEKILVQFSQLVVEQRGIKEIDINPFLVSPERMIALDARIILHPADLPPEKLPKLAIRPYPTQYALPWTMRNGAQVMIRPIRPEDEPAMVKFHETLSEKTILAHYFRPLDFKTRVAHQRLTRICFNDYDREIALVADHVDARTKEHEIIASGRLCKLFGTNDGEFVLIVSDRYQRSGLGTEILRRLLHVGREEKLDRILAKMLANNTDMQQICKKLGFCLYPATEQEGIVIAEIALKA